MDNGVILNYSYPPSTTPSAVVEELPEPPSYIECNEEEGEEYLVLDKPNYDELFKKLLDRLKDKWDRDAGEIVAHYNEIDKSILTKMNGEIEEIKNHYSKFVVENKNKLNVELRRYNSMKEKQINEILHTHQFASRYEVGGGGGSANINYVTSVVNLLKSIFY